jgi:hypothetical protein
VAACGRRQGQGQPAGKGRVASCASRQGPRRAASRKPGGGAGWLAKNLRPACRIVDLRARRRIKTTHKRSYFCPPLRAKITLFCASERQARRLPAATKLDFLFFTVAAGGSLCCRSLVFFRRRRPNPTRRLPFGFGSRFFDSQPAPLKGWLAAAPLGFFFQNQESFFRRGSRAGNFSQNGSLGSQSVSNPKRFGFSLRRGCWFPTGHRFAVRVWFKAGARFNPERFGSWLRV